MKRALIVIAAIILVAWAATALISRAVSRADQAIATSGERPWPGGLGPIESAGTRFPPRQANEASARFTALAKALPENEAVTAFVGRELSRGEPGIGEPPPLPGVTAIRDLLLGERIVWPRRGGIVEVGNPETSARRVLQMTAARALVATALARGRAGDAGAWDELRAVWILARSLEGQPEMMEQTAALAMVRMTNAAAWKMPLPAPGWLAELHGRDAVLPLLDAFQANTAAYWKNGAVIPTTWNAEAVEHDRRIAEALYGETRCDVTPEVNKHGPDLTEIWRRAFRYRAEREATANALRVREGTPIETKSACSDGAWTFDGTTLRFSRPISMRPPDTPMPLALRVVR